MSRRKEIEAEIAKLQAELEAMPKNEPVVGMLCVFGKNEDTALDILTENCEGAYYVGKDRSSEYCTPAPTPWIKVVGGKAPEWDGEIIILTAVGRVNIGPVSAFAWELPAPRDITHWMPNILEEGE